MKKIKIIKWAIGFITLVIIAISLISKIVQVIYLNNSGWDMNSFSPLYIFMILIGSVAFVSLAFLDRFVHKNAFKKPEQIVVLVLGISGLIFAVILILAKWGVI